MSIGDNVGTSYTAVGILNNFTSRRQSNTKYTHTLTPHDPAILFLGIRDKETPRSIMGLSEEVHCGVTGDRNLEATKASIPGMLESKMWWVHIMGYQEAIRSNR